VHPAARGEPKPAGVLAKALLRVGEAFALSQSEIASMLGTSAATVSRTFAGGRRIDPDSAEGRHALLLVRVFRSLDALVGGDREKARLWLRATNRHLGAAPIRLLARTEGLVHVAEYLDAMRGTL
jgi:transcriptional regulator with XRE-family HTH domain